MSDPVYFVDPKPDSQAVAATQAADAKPAAPKDPAAPTSLRKFDFSAISGKHDDDGRPVSYRMADDFAQQGYVVNPSTHSMREPKYVSLSEPKYTAADKNPTICGHPGEPSGQYALDACVDENFAGLITKFSAVWDKWQKLSTHYKVLAPNWVGHTQEIFDNQFQRFLSSVGAAPATRAGATQADLLSTSASTAVTSRPASLTPYLTVADDVEVSFAAMLSDLCNMAYEVDKLDRDLLEARYQLSLIATSISCSNTCMSTPGASELMSEAVTGAPGTEDQQEQHETHADGRVATMSTATLLDGMYGTQLAPSVVSFTMGGSPQLSPSISMLQLTSPEAVTAALTSQGHGAAFEHPVYVSTLHQALTSMGSYDDDGDISDLEHRAAMAARGPRAMLLGSSSTGVTMGTMGTLDEISMAMIQQTLAADEKTADNSEGAIAQSPTMVGLQAGGMYAAPVHAPFGGAPLAAGAMLGRGGGEFRDAVASGTLFCDASLCEDRDFVAGQFYGYKTQLVERRTSSAAGEAAPVAAVAQSGAAGGRALREEQLGRRRASSSGATAGMGGVDGDGPVAVSGPQEVTDVLNTLGNEAVAGGPPVVVACSKAPPSAWFACDDKQRGIRYFAIQGSTSLEHWQINLQFEPVVFEDPKYGVRIHRGVYEAAKVLYDDLLPLVRQHLETSPNAMVSFAGHSLGGSLGTVLMLLFVLRGVLKPSNISPVYTFGAPAVFCQGAVADAPHDRCLKCHLNCELRHAATAMGPLAGIAAMAASMDQVQTLPLGLMASLGLADDKVVNVIMHKDIVPRAFVCDYTMVAGVLQRWWPSFRDHHSLQDDAGPHKSLYNFVGRMAVLRPSSDLPFVNGPADASHPMLPNHAALYRVGLHEELVPSVDYAAASMTSWDELLVVGLSAMASGCRRHRAATAARRAAKLERMQESVMQFMNQPHPLTTLSDYQAYGPHGFVSRFHNPDNYTRALRALSGR
ncbi:hypothetical protein VOLCADRAFT_87268 [Volvox carteri f. nagariensis]|uniref:Fungal lipase-type domain-containing protein n=1 Tax=Volvox carteri f. nagariensis TaxID=3068 RepID=D8TKW3_VOLCA|nr:uncharacterized protein VOLCADRAFT_87268 [Volvox carteri f. nagariensis]EFJ51765.1 hypothetical protein VOLCADRAFT_87268 [Volvox carteri f. nagariensis]|eukprot:XP_002947175.1 hypothetical protein VOLCADRAFT_87268 [Volvox carteri f. nagariensis]